MNIEEMNKFDEQIIPEYGMSRNELTKYFEKVEDKEHWKNPINSTCVEEDIDGIRKAVVFFTGSVPFFTPLNDGTYSVKAAGYYNTIGA